MTDARQIPNLPLDNAYSTGQLIQVFEVRRRSAVFVSNGKVVMLSRIESKV
jgi:hypothetical protein